MWIAPILLSLPRSQSASQVQAHVFLPPPEGFNPDRICVLELQEHYKCRLSREQSRGISKAQLKTYKVGFCGKLPCSCVELGML